MINDLASELGRRKPAARVLHKSVEDLMKKTKNTRFRSHLFNTMDLHTQKYATETWALQKQDENVVSSIESLEKAMLEVSRLMQVGR